MIADPTLLVVDDEQVYCDGCERIFSRQGFHVEGSNDAEEALGLAKQNNYAAIILDVKMPNMDGIRFLEHLRAMKPDTPVILMTGYPSIQNAASAIRLGASDYVTKPFTPEQITSAVRGLLHTEADDSEPQTEHQTAEESPHTEPGDLAFLGRAWANLGDRAAVRVGGTVPRPDSTFSELRLPRVGDIVRQGLPLFAVCNNDGVITTVPAPVTGMVLEVNSALETNPELLWEHPCGTGMDRQNRTDSPRTRRNSPGIAQRRGSHNESRVRRVLPRQTDQLRLHRTPGRPHRYRWAASLGRDNRSGPPRCSLVW